MDKKQNGKKSGFSRRELLKMAVAGTAAAVVPVNLAGAAGRSSTALQEEITINIDFRGYGPDPLGEDVVQGTALKNLLEEYKDLHPNVTVNHTPIDPGAWNDIQQWVGRRLVAEDGPDLLFGNWTYLIEEWMQADLVAFWDAYLEMPNPYMEGNDTWGNQFIKPGERQSNGQTAWLGLDNTTLWSFYNRNMFDEMGLVPPTTWPEQLALFETISDNGKIPVADYHSLAYAVWSFDMVANQILHSVFEEIAAGDLREPLPAQVAEAVLDGRYAISSPQYQDSFNIVSEWWRSAPEGAYSGGDDLGYQLFLSSEAATRYGGVWENGNLLKDMTENENPFEWGAYPIPIVPKSMSQYSTQKQTAAVFVAGNTLFTLPAYNRDAKRDQTADLLMFLSVPENLGKLIAEDQGFVPNIKNTPLPDTLAGFSVDEDATYWYVNSWGNTHITPEARDAWVRNWQLVLLDSMSVSEFTNVMQAELEKAAEDTLNA